MRDKRTERRREDEPEPVVSATEMTGLIPALPEDGDEAAYRALCPIPRQKESPRSRR